jgi:ion channel
MNRRVWLLIGLGLTVVLGFAGGMLAYALPYAVGAYDLGGLWPAGAAIGIALGLYFSRLFVRKRARIILPVINIIITLVILFQAIFWWFVFIPSDAGPIIGFVLLIPLMVVAIISFWMRRLASLWAIAHEAINLMALIIVNFSWWYWSQSIHNSGCMNVELTRADSVYFTLTTLATVGYGDIHPASEACRAIVSWQILVGFFFVAIILALTVSRVVETSESSAEAQAVLSAIAQMRERIEEIDRGLAELRASLNETSAASLRNAVKRRIARLYGRP